MKLRTLDELDSAIDRETAWRKRELTTILFDAQSSRERTRPVAIRAGVALLYAHWEGWIKAVGEYYVAFVAQKRLPYDGLSSSLLGFALKTRIVELGDAKAARVHTDFADFLRQKLGSEPARFPDRGAIRTDANLSSRVLRDIIERLGLSYVPYELNANLIDERLVRARNEVAHGDHALMDLSEFESLHSEVVRMLRQFTTDIMNAASVEAYRRTAAA